MFDPTTIPSRFIGCDVGKHAVVAFDSLTGACLSLPNAPEALAAFAAGLDAASLVVCEATGGYEAALLVALAQPGRATHRADARKVKAFIRSLGVLGKTDAIDARALARYGQERHDRLPLWRPRSEQAEGLHTMVTTRRDLVAQRAAFQKRLDAPKAAPVAARLAPVVQTLDAQIAALEADIDALIASCATLNRRRRVLRAIPGVGQATAAALLALMPELGTLPRRKAVALAGLAPHPRQSGKTDARRRTRGGRPEVKAALFMAAMSACQHNPTIRAFYQRLLANGKKPLVALTAAMRKLITIANAKLRDAAQPI